MNGHLALRPPTRVPVGFGHRIVEKLLGHWIDIDHGLDYGKEKLYSIYVYVLTVVDPVTNVASPAPLVDELDERIDVGAALPTSAKSK